jgi:hypothetical protein
MEAVEFTGKTKTQPVDFLWETRGSRKGTLGIFKTEELQWSRSNEL